MVRPRCSVFIAASLDGFIARSDGAIDWLSMVERPGQDYGIREFYASVDAILMGRKTYESALGGGAWPYAGMRCLVLTTKPHASSHHGEEFVSGDVETIVERLGVEGVGRLYVDGGVVIGQFLAAKLVDDVTVSIIPILLGEGTPLAPRIGRDVALELMSHRAFESGLVQLVYRVR